MGLPWCHFTQRLSVQLPVQGLPVWSLIRELRSHMPHGQKTKTWNRSNVVTNTINTSKMVHIKKKKKELFLPTIQSTLTFNIPFTNSPIEKSAKERTNSLQERFLCIFFRCLIILITREKEIKALPIKIAKLKDTWQGTELVWAGGNRLAHTWLVKVKTDVSALECTSEIPINIIPLWLHPSGLLAFSRNEIFTRLFTATLSVIATGWNNLMVINGRRKFCSSIQRIIHNHKKWGLLWIKFSKWKKKDAEQQVLFCASVCVEEEIYTSFCIELGY